MFCRGLSKWRSGAWKLGFWASGSPGSLCWTRRDFQTFNLEIKLVFQIEATESYVRLLQRGPQQPSSEGGLCFNNSLMTLNSVPTTFNLNGPNVEVHATAGPGSSTCCIPHPTPPLNVPIAKGLPTIPFETSKETHCKLAFPTGTLWVMLTTS